MRLGEQRHPGRIPGVRGDLPSSNRSDVECDPVVDQINNDEAGDGSSFDVNAVGPTH